MSRSSPSPPSSSVFPVALIFLSSNLHASNTKAQRRRLRPLEYSSMFTFFPLSFFFTTPLQSSSDCPYPAGARSSLATINPKVDFSHSNEILSYIFQFTFSLDPHNWGSALSPELVESDDELDDWPSKENSIKGFTSSFFSGRMGNTACLVILCVAVLLLL